jgi:hypothetical protein
MMAATAAKRAAADADAPVDDTIRDALLESMLLHARTLTDFFVRPSGQRTDIRHDDFTPEAPKWTPAPRDAADRARAAIPAMNKHLAHLTWERVEDGKQGWQPGTIVQDLMQIAEAWCDHLAQHDADIATQFGLKLTQAYLALGLPRVPAQPTEPEGNA